MAFVLTGRRRTGRESITAGPVVALAMLLVTLGPTACGDGKPPTDPPTPSTTARPPDRDALAALAAAAKDRRYVATYVLAAPQRPDRTVTVAIATDDSWVVAVPGAALSGLADVAIFRSSDGLFHCALGPAAGAAGRRPDLPPVTPGCAMVRRLTPSTDPRVHHIFTDWIDALTDRATALSVTAAALPPGARGECFSVQPISAALAPPVDPGIYCYAQDGILTAAHTEFGSLTLAGAVAPGPPTIAQPAPTVDGPPLPMRAPPPPPPTSPPPTSTAAR